MEKLLSIGEMNGGLVGRGAEMTRKEDFPEKG